MTNRGWTESNLTAIYQRTHNGDVISNAETGDVYVKYGSSYHPLSIDPSKEIRGRTKLPPGMYTHQGNIQGLGPAILSMLDVVHKLKAEGTYPYE